MESAISEVFVTSVSQKWEITRLLLSTERKLRTGSHSVPISMRTFNHLDCQYTSLTPHFAFSCTHCVNVNEDRSILSAAKF